MGGYVADELPDWARPPGITEVPADIQMPAWASADPKSRLVATPAEADYVLAIDVSNLAWRSAFAHSTLTTPSGEASGAVFGAYSEILSKIDRLRSGKWCLAFCYDHRDAKAARRAVLPHYKTRDPHDEVENPIPKVEDALAPLTGIHVRAAEREADDAAAWVATMCAGTPVLLYSNDKDFWAQIRPGVGVLSPTKGGYVGPADVREKFIVTEKPCQIPLVKAMLGDTSDTIGGVPRLVKKTIQPYFDLGVETVEQLYAALEGNAYSGLSTKAAEKIAAHRGEADQNFRVVSAWIDGFGRGSMRVERGDGAAVQRVAERYSLRHFADKLPVLTGAETSTAGAGFGQGWP